MVVDSGQGRIESVARRLPVGLGCRELAAKLGVDPETVENDAATDAPF